MRAFPPAARSRGVPAPSPIPPASRDPSVPALLPVSGPPPRRPSPDAGPGCAQQHLHPHRQRARPGRWPAQQPQAGQELAETLMREDEAVASRSTSARPSAATASPQASRSASRRSSPFGQCLSCSHRATVPQRTSTEQRWCGGRLWLASPRHCFSACLARLASNRLRSGNRRSAVVRQASAWAMTAVGVRQQSQVAGQQGGWATGAGTRCARVRGAGAATARRCAAQRGPAPARQSLQSHSSHCAEVHRVQAQLQCRLVGLQRLQCCCQAPSGLA